MPFRPHSLPYKLRTLFDAKVCTPQDLSRATGISLTSIDRMLRGAVPDPQTRLQIDKALAYYTRRRSRHLRIEPPANEIAPPPVRGVFETRHEFPGVRCFQVITARGEKRLEVLAPSGDVNAILIEFMDEWLNLLDPPLSLISQEPSAEPGQ